LVAVFRSHLDLIKVIKDIQLGEIESCVAVDFVRVLDNDQVEPPTSALSSSGNTKLFADLL
jgi:hypothetical protein